MSARPTVAIALTLYLALASPAFSQDIPAPFEGLMLQEMHRTVMDDLRERNLGIRGNSPARPRATTARRAAAGQTVSTAYRPSPQVSAKVRAQFAQHMTRQTGPEGGRKVAAAMQARDPVRNWAQLVAADGLRPGDAADALAGYWVLNWMIANRGDNNRVQTLAVRDQVRAIMTSNPAYARLSEAQRQEFAEVLMLNFLVQQAAYVDALKRGDQAALQRLGDAAVARFKGEMGVDLRRLRLTERGFAKG
ncbi:hypothetical protein SGCZBJ_07770 [Caulobacter zeae]|uniref:Uncharacterized protein n=1 Tax=Caulobacter zeae TaxID=2055137 RepID=A0A2N5DMM4_9CAUL|nr:DUF6683 family protein [Caulobacter zeae]PLR27287.1 hypothetical protein SGCZBJ_07770 [Caulobacter zeae]